MDRHLVFSPEWFSALMRSFDRCCDELGERLGVFSFKAQYVITGTLGGAVRYVEEIRDGRMVYIGLGEATAPDVVLTMSIGDYKKLVDELMSSHQLETCRVEGALEKLEPAVTVRASEEYRGHKERTRDFTRWS